MGRPKEQTEDELREAVQGPAILLRQEHHPQNGRCVSGEAVATRIRAPKLTALLSFRHTGKRYVYRFVCDLQSLLNFSPEQLHQIVDVKLESKDDDACMPSQTMVLNGNHALLPTLS